MKKYTGKQLKEFKKIRALGNIEGSLEEAERSLQLKFTEREIDALISFVWHSPQLQSIRERLGKMEAKKT